MNADSVMRTGGERQASLHRLFAPRSVAVVGASANPRKIGGRPIRYLLTHGYQGRVFPINPNHSEVQGLTGYRAISAVPEPIDLAVIAVPAEEVPGVITDCGRCGVAFVVVFSAGFSETGHEGALLESRVGAAAAEFGIRVCGPNSLGLISEPARLTATFAGSLERRGSMLGGQVALLSQSGALGAFIYSMAQDQGVGIRHFVSVGNEIDLQVSDYIDYLALDPETRSIVGYLEGVRDGPRFIRAVDKAVRTGKAVGFIKIGRSEASRRAALSHTGALTGADEIYDAVFRQAGVTRLEGIQELLDFAALTTRVDHYPDIPQVLIASISGGAGAWAADAFAKNGVELTALAPATTDRLASILPRFASRVNPVDFTPQVINHAGMLGATVATMLADPNAGSLLIVIGLQEEEGVRLAEEICAAAKSSDKLITVAWLLGPPAAYKVLEDAGIPTFRDLSRCVSAMASVINYGVWQVGPDGVSSAAGRQLGRLGRPAARLVQGVLDEWQAKRLLADLAIRVPEGRLTRTVKEAVRAAAMIGYPVVIKAVSANLHHKTEHGLVRTNLNGEDDLISAYRALRAAADDYLPKGAPILVEEMVLGGVEVGVGINRDATFGPVLSFGLGGVHLELASQMAIRVGEVDREAAVKLISQSAAARLLSGFRGAPPADVEAVVDCLVKLSRFVADAGTSVQEIEINPLIVLPAGGGAVAVDALVAGATELGSEGTVGG
jgi:acetyltransferase